MYWICVLLNKRCSAYPACGLEVQLAGAEYVELPVTEAIANGNLVTAPAWPAHPRGLQEFTNVLGTKIEHKVYC
jgi:protease I